MCGDLRRILQYPGAQHIEMPPILIPWWVPTKLKQKYGVTLGITTSVHGLFGEGLLIKATPMFRYF